jgi:hypothetical protein
VLAIRCRGACPTAAYETSTELASATSGHAVAAQFAYATFDGGANGNVGDWRTGFDLAQCRGDLVVGVTGFAQQRPYYRSGFAAIF